MRKSTFIWVILLLLLTPLFSEEAKTTEISGVQVEWMIQDSYVLITISAETTGWIALGIEPEHMMKGADIYIGYVDDEGNIFLEDQYGNSSIGHKSDESMGGSSDVEIIEGKEENGRTTITFRIPRDSGDEYDKVLNSGEEYTLITAYSNRDNLRTKHKTRGSGTLEL